MILQWRSLVMLTALGIACLSAVAAENPLAKTGEAASGAPAAKAAPAERPDRSLREQDIYIPYDKLRQVFEKHGRGVFLPYEQFQELWQAAHDKTRPAAEPRPPVGALITEIENEAAVAKDVVQVKARLKIDLLTEGWHEVPLRLSDAAITSATLRRGGETGTGASPETPAKDSLGNGSKPAPVSPPPRDETARILGGAGEDHRLLVEKKGKEPEEIELLLEYARAITRAPGENSVAFQAPQAPVNRWRVRIPQSGVKVNLHPLIAATEVPREATKALAGKPAGTAKPEANSAAPPPKSPDETVVLAFVGPAPSVRIDWTPRAEGAVGLTALASVRSEQQVWINEGQTRIRANLDYAISRAELSQLAVEVPADYQVVNIADANVRQWSVEPAAKDAAGRRVTVQLSEPVKGSQRIAVELEKFTGRKDETRTGPAKLNVPAVKALNVGRQQGFVVVRVAAELRAEAAPGAGLSQVDAGRLPDPLNKEPWTFAYQYAAVPFELELSLEEVQPRISADSLVEARLEPERLSLDLTAVFVIERAGVFKLELDVPEGFDVRQVRGRDLPGDDAHKAAAVQVDSHRLEGPKKTHLVVHLSRKTMGRVALAVELQRELQEPGLRSPDEKAAEVPLPIPVVPKGTVERAVGRLLISAPESLQVRADKPEGLRDTSAREALEGIPSALTPALGQGDGGNGMRPVLAYAFTQDPVKLRLTAQRRKPHVTMRQLLVARIEEGIIKYQATFEYDVLYSGVKSLRIDVPADVAAGLRNNTPAIREKTIGTPKPEPAKGWVAWSFSGDPELIGKGQIDLTWEKKIDKLEVGKSLDLVVPKLAPQGADNAWGQIVLVKAESLDVHESDEPDGLQPKDPQHDLAAKVSGAARAFEFHGDWTLPITITRYELEEVKRTSIDRAVARMVMTPAGEISIQALYRMRSARQRLTVGLPEDAKFDTDPLRINGQPVGLEQGPSGEFFIPLTTSSADEPFLLELRYTAPANGGQFDLPAFPEDAAQKSDVAVQKVYLCAFVPETKALLGTAGPWTEEFRWDLGDPSLHWQPRSNQDDKGLVNWVCEGVKCPALSPDSFHTDGRLYVFSTLRPAAPPDGSLRMVLMDRRGLSALIFAVVVLGGVVLVPVRFLGRAVAAGSLLVALVLAGVFCTTFSYQVLNGTLVLAVFIVLVIWGLVFLARVRLATAALGQAMAARLAAKPAAPVPPPPPVHQPAPPAGDNSAIAPEGGPSHE
jgi:hypothetical protein